MSHPIEPTLRLNNEVPHAESIKELRCDYCRENKAKSVYEQERELLHKQLELLAERSKGCAPPELAELSAQMVAIYSLLKL